MKIIADSGSTKTAWALIKDSAVEYIIGQGINPVVCDEQQIKEIIETDLVSHIAGMTVDEVYFYGAGCTSEKSIVVMQCLQELFGNDCEVVVGSDMLGAARALYGDKPGVACILGTGSNSCYYDGRHIVDNVPALGFILGDEGSGAYIGKRLVGDMFKRQFDDELYDCFIKETGLTMAMVIENVYRQPLPNRFLASLTKFCHTHREHPQMKDFLVDCFSEFVRRNISGYKKLAVENSVGFVGSVAFYFRDELNSALTRHGYALGQVLKSPIEGLVDQFLRK